MRENTEIFKFPTMAIQSESNQVLEV